MGLLLFEPGFTWLVCPDLMETPLFVNSKSRVIKLCWVIKLYFLQYMTPLASEVPEIQQIGSIARQKIRVIVRSKIWVG